MLQIKVNVDATRALAKLRNAEKRMRYVVVNAINDTARVVQIAEIEDASKQLTIRSAFTRRRLAVLHKAQASRRVPFATVSVDTRNSRLFAGQLETGGEKEPKAHGEVAVPFTGGRARPSFQQTVRPSLWTKSLQLRHQRMWGEGDTGGGGTASRHVSAGPGPVRGQKRTYVVPGVGIFQRQGRRRGSKTTLLYGLHMGPVRLPHRLRYFEIARRIVAGVFRANIEVQIEATIKYNRGR